MAPAPLRLPMQVPGLPGPRAGVGGAGGRAAPRWHQSRQGARAFGDVGGCFVRPVAPSEGAPWQPPSTQAKQSTFPASLSWGSAQLNTTRRSALPCRLLHLLSLGLPPWCPTNPAICPPFRSYTHKHTPTAQQRHRGPTPTPPPRCLQIDGTTEKGLLTRFSVQHFPSIYHINGTETREYSGGRTLKKVWCTAQHSVAGRG